MSALTEQIAQARDNVRHTLEGPGTMFPGQNLRHVDDCPGCAIAAALDLIAQHASRMEIALTEIQEDAVAGIASTNRLPYLTGIGVKATHALRLAAPEETA